MWFGISQIILRYKTLILIVLAGITAFFGYYAFTSLRIDNKFGAMLPNDSPAKVSYERAKKLFKESENVFVIAIDADSLKNVSHFKSWYDLGNEISKLPGIDSVFSEAHMYRLEKDTAKKAFYFDKLINAPPTSKAGLDSIRNMIYSHPFYRGFLFSEDEKTSLMMVFINEKTLSNLKKANVVTDIVDIVETHTGEFGDIKYSGLPYIRVMVGKKVLNELYMFIALAIGVLSIVLFIFFRSIKIVLMCNVVVIVGVIWSLGSIGFMGFKLSILMSLIPPLVIVIGIPNCVYLLTKYHQEYVIHGNKVKALSRIIQKIGNATFLTNLTTALGFSTFIFTNGEKLMEFGIAASIDILFVFILAITILPIILSYVPPPNNKHLKHLEKQWLHYTVEKLEYFVTHHRKWVYIFAIVIVGVSIFGMTKMSATGNITSDLPQNDPIVQDLEHIEEHFGGVIPFQVMINTKSKNRALRIETLEKIDSVQRLLETYDEFSKTLSIADGAKIINMSFFGHNPEQYKLTKDRMKQSFLSPYLQNAENSSEGTMNPFLDSSGVITRISAQIQDIGSYKVEELVLDLNPKIENILNPKRERNTALIDSISGLNGGAKDEALADFYKSHPKIRDNVIEHYVGNDESALEEFEIYPEKIKEFHAKNDFNDVLAGAAEQEYMEFELTGTAVVAAEGTMYLVYNLILSLCIAVVIISILMAILFQSWRMVIVSLIPNFIPLIVTAGVMGFTGISIKPSTILVFSIAFGISVDDTIHFLAKFRQELATKKHDLKYCILAALRETGVSMIYTSIVLFFGFSMFSMSQFGGTKALGMLVSLTLLIAMFANLLVLPSLLLWMDKALTSKEARKPYIEFYDEDIDIELDKLEVEEKQRKIEETQDKDSTT